MRNVPRSQAVAEVIGSRDDREWIAQVWLNIARRTLGLQTRGVGFEHLPAVGRIAVTSPPLGLLQRRHVKIGELTNIGTESNSLEEVQAGGPGVEPDRRPSIEDGDDFHSARAFPPAGNAIVKVVPSPGALPTLIDAPIASAQSRTIASPRPRPSMPVSAWAR